MKNLSVEERLVLPMEELLRTSSSVLSMETDFSSTTEPVVMGEGWDKWLLGISSGTICNGVDYMRHKIETAVCSIHF